MPASEDGGDEALLDTDALAAEPDSAELAAFGPLAERLDPRPPPRLPPGTILADGFEVEEVLGTGGMGIVYRARDLKLGRRVALKLHRPMAKGTERLMREAAAMAKLTHPNVGTVHEVGTHEGMLFIAMEFIDGVTARAWITQAERTPAQIMALYLAAGRGLAAAHHAGLVHRDFKPENVLVGPDDVPRVVDFGLARVATDTSPMLLEPSSLPTSPGSITVTGAVAGTPAYMAPEQFSGGEVDAHADQFSFCVSLYEAVYGERPFAGTSAVELLSAMVRDPIRSPPAGHRVPKTLRRLLVRGLSARPVERWPSMDALLEQLERLLAPRARRWILLSLGVGVLGVGGGLALGALGEAKERCTDAHRHLTNIWDEGRRQEVKASILGTGLIYAPGTWERVERRLDDYADAWAGKYTEVCESSTVDAQAQRDRRLRLDCVHHRSRALRATVDQLAKADRVVVGNAVQLAGGLPGFGWCDDLDALRAAVPPPEDPDVRREVEALRDRLAAIQAARRAGEFETALVQIEPIVDEAMALEYAPLIAEAKAERGQLRNKNGHYVEAERELREAYEAAIEHRLDPLALRTAQNLTALIGDRQKRFAEGETWGGVALAHAKRSGDEVAKGISLHGLGQVAYSRGEYEQAQQLYESALRSLEMALGSDHPRVATTLNNLGLVSGATGEYERAKVYYERALRTRQEALGPDYPGVAMSLGNLGNLLQTQGEYEQAKLHHERALQISHDALGPDHPDVAMALNNLGTALMSQGEYGQAQSHYERAARIFEEAYGAEHPDVATSVNNVGDALQAQGKLEQAQPYIERALRIREKALGPDHPNVATSLLELGQILMARGEYEKARESYERALRIQHEALGPEHPRIASSAGLLGNVLEAQGEYEQAQLSFERALWIREAALGAEHPKVAGSLLDLGSVSRARGMNEQAQQYIERALPIVEKAFGADHRNVGVTLMNLGNVFEARGMYEQAQRHQERALSIFEKAVGANHPLVATCLNNLGNALRAQGEHERARRHLERSARIFEEVLGADHPDLAHPLIGLARVALVLEDFDGARAYAERAVSNREGGKAAPELLAEARFVLARALWADRGQRPRARVLAEQAQEALVSGEVSGNADLGLDEVEQWLETHRRP